MHHGIIGDKFNWVKHYEEACLTDEFHIKGQCQYFLNWPNSRLGGALVALHFPKRGDHLLFVSELFLNLNSSGRSQVNPLKKKARDARMHQKAEYQDPPGCRLP
jgi:hypothetical protein